MELIDKIRQSYAVTPKGFMPVIHRARNTFIGCIRADTVNMQFIRSKVDEMMAKQGMKATFISRATTDEGLLFVLAHD